MDYKEEIRKRKEEEARLDAIGLRFFEKLDCSKIDEARKKVNELLADDRFPYIRESVYRIFHHSFKMYHLREYGFQILAELFRPLGFTCPELDWEGKWIDSVLAEYRTWGLSNEMNRAVEDLYKTVFTLDRNDPDKWYEDLRQLSASFFLIQHVTIGTLNAMDLVKNKTFLVFEKPRSLHWDEALLMDAWDSLSSVRFDSEYRQKVKEILESKAL